MSEMNIFEAREEPIKVAEMLISAETEFQNSQIAIALGGPKKLYCHLYSKADLREIAQHLIAYCEHYEDKEE